MATIASTPDRPRRARKKKEARRWLREAQAILLLAAAGFGLVALATFDPALAPGVQRGPVGPVGVWLGWAFFLVQAALVVLSIAAAEAFSGIWPSSSKMRAEFSLRAAI